MSNNPAIVASQKTLSDLRTTIDENSHFRLEAGAGAGKTYSLIEGLKHLIETRANHLIRNNQQVACITYTNVAKDEISDRTDNHPLVLSDTIHGFSWSIIKSFQSKLCEFIPLLSDKWKTRVDEVGDISGFSVIYDLGYPKIEGSNIFLHHDDVIKLMTKFLELSKFKIALKSRFPIIFIDEYQDTNKALAESLVENLILSDSGIQIGLFGDHWQKIYGSNACGLIDNDNIKFISKNANFRSDKNIVTCLNNMRPELYQNESDPDSQGNIKVFLTNSWNGLRQTKSPWKNDLPETESHNFLMKTIKDLEDQGWSISNDNAKILMLTNNVLAKEQGYKELVSCFKDTDDYLKKNDKYIKYFLDILEPFYEFYENKQYGEMFAVLDQKLPKLEKHDNKKEWVEDLDKLKNIRSTGTIGEIIDLLYETQHPRLSPKVYNEHEVYCSLKKKDNTELDEEEVKKLKKIEKIRSVHYCEVNSLYKYVEEKTPFSTKHGVKGAEFDNVIVVLGGGWNHYNWPQMLEWWKNGVPSGKEATFERNRNLFYVSCSRAKHNLALLFTQKLSNDAIDQLKTLFNEENILP